MSTAGVPSLSLSQSFRMVRRVRRARSVARVNGWSMVVFGGLAVLFGLFSLTSLVTGFALLAVARMELRGARRLGLLDRSAPGALARNQMVLLCGVLVYCGWQLYAGLNGPSVFEKYPELRELSSDFEGDLDAMVRTAVIAVYVTIAGLSVVMQGLTAWYYLGQREAVARLAGGGASAGWRGVGTAAA